MDRQLEEFDLQPTPFIRGSNLRKSIKIKRQRFHSKVPPSALIYMKSLEKTQISETIRRNNSGRFTAVKALDSMKVDLEVSTISDESEITVDCDDEDVKLIQKQPVLKLRGSFKKFQKRRKLLDFFRSR